MIIFLGGCASFKLFHTDTELTEANRELARFPAKIPRACKIIKIIEPGAIHCLVQVPSFHFSKNLSKERCKVIQKTQDDIYHILKYLVSEISLKGVYKEGNKQGWEKGWESDKASQTLLKREKTKMLKSVIEFYKEMPGPRLDGIERLRREGLIVVLPAENAYSFYAHLAAFEELKAAEKAGKVSKQLILAYKEAMEARENDFLNIIRENEDSFAVVVYGADHSWRDNIRKRNIKNPTEKFSHIIVIPQTLSHLKLGF